MSKHTLAPTQVACGVGRHHSTRRDSDWLSKHGRQRHARADQVLTNVGASTSCSNLHTIPQFRYAVCSQGRDGTVRVWPLDATGSLLIRHDRQPTGVNARYAVPMAANVRRTYIYAALLHRNPTREFCSGSYNFCRFSIWESTKEQFSNPPVAAAPPVAEHTPGVSAARGGAGESRSVEPPSAVGVAPPSKGLLRQALSPATSAVQEPDSGRQNTVPHSPAVREGNGRCAAWWSDATPVRFVRPS